MRFAIALAVTITFLCPGTSSAQTGTVQGTVSGAPRVRRDAVIYLADVPRSTSKATHQYDQKNMVFIPRVLPVVRGATVQFLNSDQVRHNVFSPDYEKYNLGTWPLGETRSYVFDKCTGELCAYTQLCNVHTEMEGFIVVLQSAAFALVKADGTFTIANVPPGTWTAKLWSPKKGVAVPVKVTVTAGQTAKVTLAVN